MGKLSFDSDGIDVGTFEGDSTPIPAGTYQARIEGSKVGDTKNGRGMRAEFMLRIIQGDHEGRVAFYGINFEHESEAAQAIGQKQLAGLIKACGLSKISETEQLHGRIVKVKLAIEENEGYSPRNAVKRVFPDNGSTQAQEPKAQPAEKSSGPSWLK